MHMTMTAGRRRLIALLVAAMACFGLSLVHPGAQAKAGTLSCGFTNNEGFHNISSSQVWLRHSDADHKFVFCTYPDGILTVNGDHVYFDASQTTDNMLLSPRTACDVASTPVPGDPFVTIRNFSYTTNQYFWITGIGPSSPAKYVKLCSNF